MKKSPGMLPGLFCLTVGGIRFQHVFATFASKSKNFLDEDITD